MNNDQKRKQIEKWVKILGFAAMSFAFGPIAFLTLQGAAGLIAMLLIWTVGNALVPAFSRRMANWRLQLIKAEAAKNPIETLERDIMDKAQKLKEFKAALERSAGMVSVFRGKLEKTKREHPGSPEIVDIERNYAAMAQLVEKRKKTYQSGAGILAAATKDLDRKRDIWELVLAAREMNQAVGGGDAESEFLAKLETDTAHNSIQREMHIAFADIELELLDEPEATKETPKELSGSAPVKEAIGLAVLLFTLAAAQAQPTNTFIKGDMNIRFNSRTTPGAPDVYSLNINVDNSCAFTGTITNMPLQYRLGFVSQAAALTHDINCEVINPRNPAQRKSIGRIYGTVPISPEGLYDYGKGTLGISSGDQNGKFTGQAQGKSLVKKKKSYVASATEGLSSIYRMVGGNVQALIVTNSDNMTFSQTVFPSGPLAKYSQATVNGELKYDYDRLIWFFNNVQINYNDRGQGLGDRLSGQITYDKKRNEYVFDVRVNEPPVNESNAFTTASAKDEASFFAVDTAVPGLRGTMKYKDQAGAGDVVLASAVTIDLQGTQISQVQTMNLFKLIILACIVPMNNE